MEKKCCLETYFTKQAEVAIAKISYALERRQGLVVITGGPGTGKSTLAQQVMRQWQSARDVIPAYINRPNHKYAAGFLRQILTAFCLPEHHLAAESEAVLHEFLEAQQNAGQVCVLVIDNSHRLSANSQNALQRLFAMTTDAGPLLQVVLLAQSDLTRKVNDREFLGRRVGSRAMLDELTFEDAWGLLRHRHTGADFDSLLPDSVRRPLYEAAAGNPRALCLLCDQVLAEALAKMPAQIYRTAKEEKPWLLSSSHG